MYKDQMTPVERAQAIAEGKDIDRRPIGIMFGAPAHSLLGWTVQQEWESGRSLAEVQKKVYQTLYTDGYGSRPWAARPGFALWRGGPICPSISRCR